MKTKEVVFISGKGGTGKTTITASFIKHFQSATIVDCDVDAPDLDILLKPVIVRKEDFIATSKATIDSALCTNCGKCIEICTFKAIKAGQKIPKVLENHCEGCNTCTLVCKSNAISLMPYKTGELYESTTKYGDMIHGRLTPGEEVSGRLVSKVRKRAKKVAVYSKSELIIVDGPPGIACNVISTITGCNLAIIVTEPTTSGLHDLKRVSNLAKKLMVNVAVIINKSDLSEKYNKKIKDYCRSNNITLISEFIYSDTIRQSINQREIPSVLNLGIVNKIKELLYS
jgi:MinD superfamily P-loop ATPase